MDRNGRQTCSMKSSLDRQASRRQFIQQCGRYGICVLPAMAIVLNAGRIPVSFAQTYTAGDTATVDGFKIAVLEGSVTVHNPPCEQTFFEKLIDNIKKIFGSRRSISTAGQCSTIRD